MTPAAETFPAVAGTTLSRDLSGGEVHRWRLPLQAGQLADLALEQDGIDVVVSLRAPAARSSRRVDSPNGSRGREPLPVLAEAAGELVLEVRSLSPTDPPGRYRLQLLILGPASGEDRQRVEAEDALSAAEALRLSGSAAGLAQALRLYPRAIATFRARGDLDRLGDALFFEAAARAAQGDLDGAEAGFRASLASFRGTNDPRKAANALDSLGRVLWRRGEPSAAVVVYGEALSLHRATGELRSETATCANLAEASASLGRVEEALRYHEQALEGWQRLGASPERGITLSSLGWLYFTLGEDEVALDALAEALPLLEAAGARRHVAVALGRRGAVRVKLGDPAAPADLEQALSLQRELGDRREEAVMLYYLGLAERRGGNFGGARSRTGEGLALARSLGDRWSQATALANLGWIEDAEGRPDAAAGRFTAARDLFARVGDRSGEANALFGLARSSRAGGDLASAREAITDALARVEALRTEPASAGLRASFLAERQSYYAFAVEVLMAEHRQAPAVGFDRAALEVAERAKARSLLDTLAESGLTERPSPDPSRAAERRALEERLHALAEELARSPPSERRAGLEREQRRATARLDRLETETRLEHPVWSSLAAPRPLPAAEIQTLLDPGTLLLEVALGAERSTLWAVEPTRVGSFELPRRSALEAVARRAHTLTARSHKSTARAAADLALAEASRLLLAPVADRLAGKRLLIVPDGALHYLPFAALPEPGHPDRPLIAEHEVITLPSASVLASLRERGRERRAAPRTVAVFADPLFDPHEARFPPLPGSREEAAAILRWADPDRSFVALGADASREAVLAADLGRYPLLHFATHGVVDSRQPRLSGLMLSRLDAKGRSRRGFLSTGDVLDLRLDAELVTLSACDTALGKEVNGEGLVGLTRSFLAAGAERVLVSLWRVNDRATADLMERFYRALLREREPPAAALRRAQTDLAREGPWRAPAYWGGFVIQGDWRSRTPQQTAMTRELSP